MSAPNPTYNPDTHFLQPKITGYRQLQAEETALMNEVKSYGGELQQLIGNLREVGADPRWVSIGETHLQQGLMALTRAIAKPTSF
jgi:hypothetical protein